MNLKKTIIKQKKLFFESLQSIEISFKWFKPSVLWSGKGIHICQPVEAIVLEQESMFTQFDQPSQTLMSFAAQFLSNYKSDTNNNPAFKSCLLRIAGSYNMTFHV
jgi:hypothetical protein